MKTTTRIGSWAAVIGMALANVTVAGAAPADGNRPSAPAAQGRRDPDRTCGPKGQPGKRFEKADKNGDGFLTKDEVGEKRWARLSVADANKDNRVSKAEIEKARSEGKLGRRGPRGKGPKPSK